MNSWQHLTLGAFRTEIGKGVEWKYPLSLDLSGDALNGRQLPSNIEAKIDGVVLRSSALFGHRNLMHPIANSKHEKGPEAKPSPAHVNSRREPTLLISPLSGKPNEIGGTSPLVERHRSRQQ